MLKISLQTWPRFEKLTNIIERSRQSWRDGGNLATISLRLRNSQTWRDLYKSRLDLGNLGEMEDILLRSRRDFRISQTSWQDLYISQRDIGNLGEISVIISHRESSQTSCEHHCKHHGKISTISARSQLSNLGKMRDMCHDHDKISARSLQSPQDLANLPNLGKILV